MSTINVKTKVTLKKLAEIKANRERFACLPRLIATRISICPPTSRRAGCAPSAILFKDFAIPGGKRLHFARR